MQRPETTCEVHGSAKQKECFYVVAILGCSIVSLMLLVRGGNRVEIEGIVIYAPTDICRHD